MCWLFRRREPTATARNSHVRPMAAALEEAGIAFVCTTCGRDDLPPTGGWDPPICEECDAAINFDALVEELDEPD